MEVTAMIADADTGESLVKLMRKPMKGINQYDLRQKLLENEESVISLIQSKSLRNKQDIFIENALCFFLRCKENVSDWIVENFDNFSSEYLQCMFCLVIGFRGEKELIPFLIEKAQYFERMYPDDTFDQGPAFAVQELYYRFLD